MTKIAKITPHVTEKSTQSLEYERLNKILKEEMTVLDHNVTINP